MCSTFFIKYANVAWRMSWLTPGVQITGASWCTALHSSGRVSRLGLTCGLNNVACGDATQGLTVDWADRLSSWAV